MSYIDHYQFYLSQAKKDIENCRKTGKRIVFGYTSNTDVLLEYDEEAFSEVIFSYLKSAPYKDDKDVIDSMETFARYITYYMLNGLGGEVEITEYSVVEYLLSHFKNGYSLGGTGAQGAAALASAGMPVIVHISDKSQMVCEMMSYPEVETIKEGKRVALTDIQQGEPVYHIVFPFTKGDTFRIGEKEYTIPIANRVILDYDQMHKDIVVNRDFMQYIEKNASDIIAYNLSGYNAIRDCELVKKRLQELVAHYRKVKERNPECIIYFESAHYLNPEVKYAVYKEISPYINIMGMNEEELVKHTQDNNVSINKDNLSDVIRGMEVIMKSYHVTGIIMHTKDYSFYYGDELKGIDVEKALTMGNLLSGTRARVGHYGTLTECAESIEKMPLSETGLRFAEELETISLDKQAVLVPSRYIDKPVCTIGLGDTFVAGVQFAFIK